MIQRTASQLADALRDRYVIERELGRAGWRQSIARDLKHGRHLALKVLHPELAASLSPERFQREIATVARLQHPHILTVHDSGDIAGQLWFTMPFVEGESLRDRLRRGAVSRETSPSELGRVLFHARPVRQLGEPGRRT